MSYVSIHGPLFASWFQPPQSTLTSLHDKYTDVNVTSPNLEAVTSGASAGACRALPLTLLMGAKLMDGLVAVTGNVCGPVEGCV